jgi:hypothetical protein
MSKILAENLGGKFLRKIQAENSCRKFSRKILAENLGGKFRHLTKFVLVYRIYVPGKNSGVR